MTGVAVATGTAVARAGVAVAASDTCRVWVSGFSANDAAKRTIAIAAPLATPLSRWALAAAGLAAVLAGVAMKAVILRGASHVQGFALPSKPVRGTSR